MWRRIPKNWKNLLVVMAIGLLSVFVLSCGGGGGSDDDDDTTYDATGTWDVVATFDLDNLDTNFQCIPGDSPEDDTSESTWTITQTGNSFSMIDEDGHTVNGTINGATYTFTGSWIEPNDTSDFTITVSGSVTLNASSSFSGNSTVDATNSIGNYCEWDETIVGTKQSSSTSLTIIGESGNQVSMNGTWEGNCSADSDDGSSDKSTVTISGSSFSVVQNFWFNSMLCTGASDVTENFGGTANLGDELTVTMNASNVTATELDIVITDAEVTINNPDILGDINADQECGFNDWVVGVAKDVLGTNCMPNSSQKDVVYIDDTANPDVWYDGDDGGALNPDGYPMIIDLDTEMKRK